MTRATLHGITGSPWAAAIFPEAVSVDGLVVPALDRSANGLVMSELGELLRNATSAESLGLADDPGLSESGHRQLMGARVTDGGGARRLLLLNLGATPLTLDLGDVTSPPFDFVVLAADDPKARVADSLASLRREAGQSSSPTLEVPPWSSTRIW